MVCRFIFFHSANNGELKGCVLMNWMLVIIILLVFLLILLIFTSINIDLHYHHAGNDDQLTVKFRAWFDLLHYTIDVPFIDMREDKAILSFTQKKGIDIEDEEPRTEEVTANDILEKIEEVKKLLQHVVGLHKIIRKLLKKVYVHTFTWHSVIGNGNAAHTGILTGSAWALKSSIMGGLTTYLHFKKMPAMTITPDFQKSAASTSISCIISLKLGDAIWAGIKLFRHWKGGRLKFNKTKQSRVKQNF